jgi:hypothetical protein
MPIMKTQPQPSDREVLAGLVERVTYQNADNGFCVIRVKARGHRLHHRRERERVAASGNSECRCQSICCVRRSRKCDGRDGSKEEKGVRAPGAKSGVSVERSSAEGLLRGSK